MQPVIRQFFNVEKYNPHLAFSLWTDVQGNDNRLCFASRVAAFLTQTVCLDDTTVKFEIWDTAGQERYHSLAPMYYRGAQAAIVVYDITNTVSDKPRWADFCYRCAVPCPLVWVDDYFIR